MRQTSSRSIAAIFVVASCLLFPPIRGDWSFDNLGSVNGGINCGVCTAMIAFTEQYMQVHNVSLTHALERFCSFLPQELLPACSTAVEFLAPLLIDLAAETLGPDETCHALHFCYTQEGTDTCRSFTPESQVHLIEKRASKARFHLQKKNPKWWQWEKEILQKRRPEGEGASICSIPGIHEICEWIYKTLHFHNPLLDIDGDGFSTMFAARGSAWRGRDCSDVSKSVHPGAQPVHGDRMFDSNCNGIYGVNDETQQSFEDQLCGSSEPRGVAILGDSIGAHFHLPPEWIDPQQVSPKAFRHIQTVIENELDWPSMSAGTGHGFNEWPEVIQGPIDSIYMRILKRNRCNHRDYQNIAFNGATTFDAANVHVKSLSRNITDRPLLLFYAFFGNDVCNKYADTFANMTTPEQMLNNTMSVMDQLHKILPRNSQVVMLSLLDGRVLYNEMHGRVHPVSSYSSKVTYADFYDFMNCLQISPCRGWLNTNQTVRDLTAMRVVELNKVLKEIGDKYKHRYPNFTIHYFESPMDRAINFWKQRGGEVWQLIEPSDGFHCNQYAQALLAREMWKDLRNYPEIIGPINVYNELIHQLFGDQGGY